MAEENTNSFSESRKPQNLEGLLKFCVENTQSEDASSTEHARELSPERKKWLSQALDGMVNDPIKEIKKYITVVGAYLGSQNPTEEARENALICLESLCDWCESLDIANDFFKIGGLTILHELITNSDAEFRARSFELVGGLVQNHPQCQEEVGVKGNFMPTMLTVLSMETDADVQAQAIRCLSCLVRNGGSEMQKVFLQNNGFAVLHKVLQSQGSFKRVVRIAFFLQSLCENNPGLKDAVYDLGTVELLAQEVQGEHEQAHEHLMAAILCLATDHRPTQQLLTKPQLNMVPFLQQRIKILTDKSENEEERQHAQDLLQIIQSSGSS